jgi:putative acetyltransferase
MPTPLPEGREETAFPPSPIRIRHFQPGDEASFKRLNEEWIVQHFVLEDKDRAVLGDPVKYILNPGGRILFACAGEETVGCCALVPDGEGVYEVAKMAVTETHRGRGIGRNILEAVIAQSRALGALRLHLETNSKLPSATYLYEAMGFQHVPEERLEPSLYARADVFMELWLG